MGAAVGASRARRRLTSAPTVRRAAIAHYAPTVLIIGVQFAAMTALAMILGTWQDEEYTLSTTAHGVFYAIHRAISYELQAPLYFTLIALLREIAPSALAARMFSVVCALGVTLSCVAIARRLWPGIDPWPVAALAAFNPFVVFAALEIRVYALALLVSALLWLTFYDGFFRAERRSARITFIVLAIAALYLEYFLAFELVGFAVALVVSGRLRALLAYALAGVICALAFVPMLFVLHGQIHAAFAVPESKPLPFYNVFFHPLVDFVIPHAYGSGVATRALNAVVVLAVVAAIVIGRPRADRAMLALGAAAATVEAIYIMLVDVLHEQLVVPRHFVALFIPETAFAYAVLAAFRNRRSANAARRTIAALVALVTILSLVATYHALAKLGDWKRVAAWLQTHARAGDTIAIAEPDAVAAFERYYHGTADVAAYPRPVDPNVYSVERMMVHSKSEALRAFSALPQHGRLWFVAFEGCDTRDRLGCLEVAAAERERYRVVKHRAFYSTTVDRLVPKRSVGGRSSSRGHKTSRGLRPATRVK
jgi:hypothetical protein